MNTKYVPGEMPMFFGTYSRNFEYARENRIKSTPAEEQLWTELKNKKLKGLKFRRQHPVGIFILDFYCHSAKLAIELDGGYHLSVEQKEYDSNRTAMLQEAGISEIRFSNSEISNNLSDVLEKIVNIIESKNG